MAPDSDPETYAVIGAAMEVHRHLGHGFLEKVYRHAMYHELGARNIPFGAEVRLAVKYKERELPVGFRPDLVCFGGLIVELKALSVVGGAELAQLLNYLKASGLQKGLLLNFGTPSLQFRRVVWSRDTSADHADDADHPDQTDE